MDPLDCKLFFSLIPLNRETVLGFEVTIFSNVEVTLGGGLHDTVFFELNSFTSDISSGCVGNCILFKEEFVGNKKFAEDIDEADNVEEGLANDGTTLSFVVRFDGLLFNGSDSVDIAGPLWHIGNTGGGIREGGVAEEIELPVLI